MSNDTAVIQGEVISQVSKQFGPEMAEYVEQSMATNPESPFVRMIADSLTAKKHLENGEIDQAATIITTYRQMAAACGIEALFDIMLDSIGISLPDAN